MAVFDLSKYDPGRHYTISASAGTGKTYNIIEILKRLVNVEGININKILIVTYTEKAAGELKNRISKELKVDANNAPIFTIHSFCQNAIKEFGISASLPLNLSLVSENAIKDYAKEYIRTGNIVKDISRFSTRIDPLIESLSSAVTDYYLNFSYLEEPSVIRQGDLSYFQSGYSILTSYPYDIIISARSFAEMLANIPEMSAYYNQLLTYPLNSPEQRFAAALRATAMYNFSFTRFNKAKKYSNDFNDAADYFNDIKKTLAKYYEYSHKMLASLYLADFYKKWQGEKEANKSQTYDDMLRYVKETVLNNPSFKAQLQKKYKYGIIDEFQDTNYKEYSIFKTIFMEDSNHHLIVVGDDKQSIMGFQGTDVEIFRKAISEITDPALGNGIKCDLTKNWRSTENMVTACNNFFMQDDFFGKTFIRSDYLSTKNTPPDKYEHEVKYDNAPTKAFWITGNLEANGSVTPEDFAIIATQQIIACCERNSSNHTRLQVRDGRSKDGFRDVYFRDFAVLARKSREMMPIMTALKRAGIPFVRYKDTNLFKGRECVHWIALLEAINTVDFTGKNRKKFKKALFTAFFGRELSDINQDCFNKDDTPEMDQINYWKTLAFEYKWEDMIDDIIINSKLTQNMKTLKELQSLACYKQIGEYCIDVLSGGAPIEKLIKALSNLSLGGEDDSLGESGEIIEKSTDFNCVKIMTIHASKGLEFPVVISVGGYSRPKASNPSYTYHDPVNHDAFLIFEKSLAKDELKDEEIDEHKRLYYVAYTRAQYINILPYYSEFGNDFLHDSFESFMTSCTADYLTICDNGKDFDTLSADAVKILAPATPAPSASTTDPVKDQNEKLKKLIEIKSKQSTYKHSYSSLSHSAYDSTKDPDDETIDKEGSMIEGLSKYDQMGMQIPCEYDTSVNPITFPPDYPRGAALGTALHEIFELIDFQSNSKDLDKIIIKAFEGQKIYIKHHPDWIDTTKEIVENVLSAKLPVINGSQVSGTSLNLKDLPLSQLKREVEFNFNVFGQNLGNYCNGFVDLIFRNGDYYSIADWKSDRTNDEFTSYSDAEELKKHVDGHYSIQRTLYAYCLILWLKLYIPGLTEEEIFEKHFGGVYYIFLRGCSKDTGNGIYCKTWKSWDELKSSFKEIMSQKEGNNVLHRFLQ